MRHVDEGALETIGAWRATAAAASKALTLGGIGCAVLTPRNALGTAGIRAACVRVTTTRGAVRGQGWVGWGGRVGCGAPYLGEQAADAVRRLCAHGEPVLDPFHVERDMLAALCDG